MLNVPLLYEVMKRCLRETVYGSRLPALQIREMNRDVPCTYENRYPGAGTVVPDDHNRVPDTWEIRITFPCT